MNLYVSSLSNFDPKPVVFGSEIPFELFKLIVAERVFNYRSNSANSFSSNRKHKFDYMKLRIFTFTGIEIID